MKLLKSVLSFVVTFTLIVTTVSSQSIISELAGVLGLLPTSQILLAGGGLLGIKLMILGRFMSLIGLLSDHQQNRLLSNMTETLPFDGNFSTTPTEPPTPDSGFFGLPDIFRRRQPKSQQDLSNETSRTTAASSLVTMTPTTTPAPVSEVPENNENLSGQRSINKKTDPPGIIFEQGTAYFPIPGLKVGFDKESNKTVLMVDPDFQPTLLLASSVSGVGLVDPETGILELDDVEEGSNDVVNKTTPRKADRNETDVKKVKDDGSEPLTVLYPLLVTRVNVSNKIEEGFSAAINESQVMIQLKNGSLVSSDSIVVKEKPSPRPVSRSRRQVEHSLSLLFDFIHSLDEKDCFAKIVCEVGAETSTPPESTTEGTNKKKSHKTKPEKERESIFGEHVSSVRKFFSSLKLSEFDPSSHSYHYISHFYFGKTHGFDSCSRGSSCSFDFGSLIKPLKKPVT